MRILCPALVLFFCLMAPERVEACSCARLLIELPVSEVIPANAPGMFIRLVDAGQRPAAGPAVDSGITVNTRNGSLDSSIETADELPGGYVLLRFGRPLSEGEIIEVVYHEPSDTKRRAAKNYRVVGASERPSTAGRLVASEAAMFRRSFPEGGSCSADWYVQGIEMKLVDTTPQAWRGHVLKRTFDDGHEILEPAYSLCGQRSLFSWQHPVVMFAKSEDAYSNGSDSMLSVGMANVAVQTYYPGAEPVLSNEVQIDVPPFEAKYESGWAREVLDDGGGAVVATRWRWAAVVGFIVLSLIAVLLHRTRRRVP